MSERPSMRCLVAVELRKAVDTRAGRWLLAAIAGLIVLDVGMQLGFRDPGANSLTTLLGNARIPADVLLPVVGILLVTSEWSQRTALVTFTLVPGRLRVVAAKALVSGLLAVAAVTAGVLAGLAGFAAGGVLDRTTGGWDLDVWFLLKLLLSQWINMGMGVALGLLILASAPAIVAFFVIPAAWSMLGALVPRLADVAGWLDLSQAIGLLAGPGALTGQERLHVLTATALWVALPAVVGVLRVRRAEIA
jgi:ABC-2 type transport system permease protein